MLSLDIVLGAVAGMYFFDKLLNTSLQLEIYILLGLAVWFIYTFEHLVDAKKIPDMANTARHSFHQKHFNVLVFFLILAGILGLYIGYISLLERKTLIYALSFGGIILINLILLKKAKGKWVVLKEFSTALFYVMGIIFAPFCFYSGNFLPQSYWLLVIGYVLVAWFNTLYISLLDMESDRMDGNISTAVVLGTEKMNAFLFYFLIFLLAFFLLLFFILQSKSYLYISILFLMALFHGIAFLQSTRHRGTIRQRLDATFMLPFLLLLI